MQKTPLVVITGPTASGKTDLAVRAAHRLKGEIISADSMQIYRYMNIGTAKPTVEEQQGIPHHMIDIVNPDEEFNVALFQKRAYETISNIWSRGKLPILAGGTGLYINSAIYPMDFTDAVDDPEYRRQLNEKLTQFGNAWLHDQLREIDPNTADRLHPNDTRRIIRAMEVYHSTGKPMEAFRQNYREMEPPYHLLLYGIAPERSMLYDRIHSRVDRMLDSGLVQEVKGLLDQGYSKNLVSMQGLGYKEIIFYLKGLSTLDEAAGILKRDTRRFAKRQMTWFRKEQRIIWLDPDKTGGLEGISEWIISDIGKKLFLNGVQ